MCFSPQRRAIFQHLDFKKCSEPDMFCTCSLENALLATAACNFWFLLWPHDSAPAALTSLLFDSPDTRIIEKTRHFATSLTFGACESSFFWLSRYCIFFLLTLLHLLTLLSADFTSSICFSSAFQLSILSEVHYLNFLRLTLIWCTQSCMKISINIVNIYQHHRSPASISNVAFAKAARSLLSSIFASWRALASWAFALARSFSFASWQTHWQEKEISLVWLFDVNKSKTCESDWKWVFWSDAFALSIAIC